MAKKKADAETPVAEDAPEQQPERPKLTKAEAVRLTLRDGIESPEDGVEHILKRYGIEITKPQFSSYKSQTKAKEAKKAGAGESGAVKVAKESGAVKIPANGSARIPVPSGNGGNPAELARQVKTLVQQYGAGAVSEMVAVFSE
jgi:cytochrome oxidase Cu insertion factor (SCO1/SenC/PrrC family)